MPISTLDDIITNIAAGKFTIAMGTSVTTSTVTAATTNSGSQTLVIAPISIGSTWPTSMASYQTAPALSGDYHHLSMVYSANASTRGGGLARFYRVGTLNLAGTGNQFTHDAATFPLTRTIFGAATQPIALIPVIMLTAPTTVTAPQFQLQTSGGAAGYVNQDGTSVIGTKNFTLPVANVGSAFFLRMNDGDYACRDITQINVSVAATAGAADVYLMELLADGIAGQHVGSLYDNVVDGGLRLCRINPAAATSGTASSFLALTSFVTSGTTPSMISLAVKG